jgi:hypothetical protein
MTSPILISYHTHGHAPSQGTFSTEFLFRPPDGWRVDWTNYNTEGPAGIYIRGGSQIWKLTGQQDIYGMWIARWPD